MNRLVHLRTPLWCSLLLFLAVAPGSAWADTPTDEAATLTSDANTLDRSTGDLPSLGVEDEDGPASNVAAADTPCCDGSKGKSGKSWGDRGKWGKNSKSWGDDHDKWGKSGDDHNKWDKNDGKWGGYDKWWDHDKWGKGDHDKWGDHDKGEKDEDHDKWGDRDKKKKWDRWKEWGETGGHNGKPWDGHHDLPKCDFCPDGTKLVSKYEWNGSRYVFEKPYGSRDVVEITGDDESGAWSSDLPIALLILKGSIDFDSFYFPGATSGTFSNETLKTKSGRTAGISNIQFCACVASEQSAPEISIVETGGVVTVTITDDTGIGSVAIDTDNLTPDAGNDFIPGEKSVTLTFTVTDDTKLATISVGATDLCGNASEKDLTVGDVCLLDQGPPVVSYSFVDPKTVVVKVTDDTGIASLTVTDDTPYDADPNSNLNLVSTSGFTPGDTEVTYTYEIISFDRNSVIQVTATDECQKASCPGDNKHPKVVGTGSGNTTVIELSDPSGIWFFQFFNATATVSHNWTTPGQPAVTATASNGRYAFIVADACNAFVLDPEAGESFSFDPMALVGGEAAAKTSELSALTLGSDLPDSYELHGNFPNPFNPSTTLRFDLPESAHVRLAVFDMLGRQVALLVDGELTAGSHEVQFDAGNLPSGTYLYRLETPARSFVKQMVLIK